MFKTMIFIIMFLIFYLLTFLVQYTSAAPANKAILTVKASPDSKFETHILIDKENFYDAMKNGVFKSVQTIPVTDTYLTLKEPGADSTYLVDSRGDLFKEQSIEMIEIPKDMKQKLMKYVKNLRTAHYGDMLPWEKVKKIIPIKMKFKVIDMESGLAFNVQRRAGNKHADVQPLTKEDTHIMKQIYRGKWSWQRKAILVQTKELLLAASMNGMPHGGDGIPTNDFSGHFCIHFLGSLTHNSKHSDPEHQLMVHKAAGKLDEYFDYASHYDIMDTFLIALNLKESQILKMSFPDTKHKQILFFLKDKDQLAGIRKRTNYKEQDFFGLLSLNIPIEVYIYRKDRSAERSFFTFNMKRTSLMEPWKIDFISIVQNQDSFLPGNPFNWRVANNSTRV